jgi:hypothetical protein
MDLEDLTPAGASFRSALRPAAGAGPVATFSAPQYMHPDAIWSPRGSELAPSQLPLVQPMQFGHGLEHEPLDSAERASQATVQATLADHAAGIRAALRPGF